MKLTYPSPRNPGPPHVSLDVPDTWDVVNVPDAALAAREGGDEPRFATNVAVEIRRYDGGFTLDEATAALNAAIDGLTEVRDVGRINVSQSGLPAYVREFAHRDPMAGTLIQNSRVVVIDEGVFVTVVQVIGASAGDSPDSVRIMRDVADSVSISPGHTS